MNLKNESELGHLYIIYLQNSEFLQTTFENYMQIMCTCTFGSLSHGTLIPLILKTSLNTNLVNIFNSTRVTCRSSLTNL